MRHLRGNKMHCYNAWSIIDATEWWHRMAEGEVRSHRGLQAYRMKEKTAQSGRLRNFGSVTRQGLWPNASATVERSCPARHASDCKTGGREAPFHWILVRGADRE